MSPAVALDPANTVSLAERISILVLRADTLSNGALAEEIEALRRDATACGHFQAAAVAQAISAALQRGDGGATIQAWLDVLRDGIVQERMGSRWGGATRSACSIRRIG